MQNEQNPIPAENTADTAVKDTVEVIGVRFKPSGKVYHFAARGNAAKTGDLVIVDTTRGLEMGTVAQSNKTIRTSEIVSPLRPVIRIATQYDINRVEANKQKEKEAFDICRKKIEAHGLSMNLVEAEYTFDNSKLLFYFTSEGRVDFRELVKDLASVFHTRIELRQIGIRDEAKMLGGLGACGRPFCCATFLPDFVQVSIKMAKEQNFSLNSAKISGACGRLMCCLRYEHETYEEALKKLPPLGSTVKTPDGNGVVTEVQTLAGLIKVRLEDKPDAPKVFPAEELTVLFLKSQRNANNGNNTASEKAKKEK